uniref:Uncharacterized protein n=1 Tax=Peronospora matthiolae TaxID=2874970 RepID=A0AAV1VPJ3_9STRA
MQLSNLTNCRPTVHYHQRKCTVEGEWTLDRFQSEVVWIGGGFEILAHGADLDVRGVDTVED